MQCSPANTAVALTKGDAAVALRKTNPTKIAYVRVATTDDNQGAGTADIAYNIAEAPRPPTSSTTPRPTARAWPTASRPRTRSSAARRSRVTACPDSTTDFTSYVTKAKGLNPGHRHVRRRDHVGHRPLPQADGPAGHGDHPARRRRRHQRRLGGHGQLVPQHRGPDGDANTYSTVAAIHDIPNPTKFATDYKAKFNTDPGAYSAPGYACTQIFLAGPPGRQHRRDGPGPAPRGGPRLRR